MQPASLSPSRGVLLQFFQKAASNVRENVGEEVDSEQLIQETCRNCLEQVGACRCRRLQGPSP